MNIIKSLFAFLVMLVATLFTASHAQAFALGNHAGGFFLGTLDCTEVNKPSTRNLCRENGWLNYDTLSGCSVATNKTTKSLTDQAADLVSKNGGKHRVTLRSPSQKMEVDLAGKSHGGIPTPHTKVSPSNPMAPKQPAYNTKNSPVRPATQQDIRTVRRYLERQNR